MNLTRLFDLQKELDSRIIKQHALQDTALFQKKILSLQVELGELANETRCFKYWSKKSPSSKYTILEEYVDCLHFILSLGIEKDFDDIVVDAKPLDSALTEQFLNLFIDINDFLICSSKDHYVTLFEDFLSLGLCLSFQEEDIEGAYLEKNLVNHQRQSSGY